MSNTGKMEEMISFVIEKEKQLRIDKATNLGNITTNDVIGAILDKVEKMFSDEDN